jgi:STE24 endopeptidase
VSRILLLLIFVFWLAAPEYAQEPTHNAWIGVAVFLGYYVALVLVMGIWGRLLARRVSAGNLRRSLRRYNVTLLVARAMIPVWFAFGVFGLGWGIAVHRALGTDALRAAQLPGLLLATLPPMAAWMGLWWSQYPAEIALREHSVLGALEADLPIHAPPGFRDYFFSNVRLRLLFTVVPIFLIVLLRDVFLFAANSRSWGVSREALDGGAMLASTGLVFIFAPEILRRVLHTERLEDGPLRRRLEAMCKHNDMRYRDILVWRTHSNMGNAAVMGILPSMRYILLSDLLLETMTDEQIEAVFAHEMGHVVHGHMAWFILFFITVMVGMEGAAQWLHQVGLLRDLADWTKPLMVAGSFFWVILLFGFLSRRFERQADVFAARTMQEKSSVGKLAELLTPDAAVIPGQVLPPALSYVGSHGAAVLSSALQRVAVINNIPTGSHSHWEGGFRKRINFIVERTSDLVHNWLHGSIQERQDYIRRLSEDPKRTIRFDRFMSRLCATLLFLLFASITFLWTLR